MLPAGLIQVTVMMEMIPKMRRTLCKPESLFLPARHASELSRGLRSAFIALQRFETFADDSGAVTSVPEGRKLLGGLEPDVLAFVVAFLLVAGLIVYWDFDGESPHVRY